MQSSVANIPTDYQVEQFSDIRCLLANLYAYSMSHRKHLKTKKGYHAATQTEYDPEQLNQIQFYLVAMMVKFQEKQWKNISLINTPKLPDILLLKLTEHTMFEGKPIENYLSPTVSSSTPDDLDKDTATRWRAIHRLTTKESRVLKELALRLS